MVQPASGGLGPLILPVIDLKRQYRQLQRELDGAVKQVMANGCFILGPHVERFEEEFAAFCHAGFGIGVATGTDALELALQAVGVGPGDLVLTPSFTFLSTVDAIRKVGARPVFLDIDPTTYTLDPEQIPARLKNIPASARRKIKAILPVHLYGHPCDMTAIGQMARRHGWRIIEDCAQAHGARWQGRPVGSFGDIGCFSFYPTKNLGAYGDAGMAVTSSKQMAQRLRMLRQQGRRDKEHQVIEGRNSRLDELQAAILRVKFKYLSDWTRQRRALAAHYTKKLHGLPIELPEEAAGAFHVYHLYAFQTTRRAALQAALARQSIGSAVHYRIPVHKQPLAHRNQAYPIHLPVTEQVAKQVLSVPLFPEMTRAEADRVCRALRTFYA